MKSNIWSNTSQTSVDERIFNAEEISQFPMSLFVLHLNDNEIKRSPVRIWNDDNAVCRETIFIKLQIWETFCIILGTFCIKSGKTIFIANLHENMLFL